ncbi:MAG TPA: aminotransferase class I/II-fold pyridoxal phosphate-dependent enzyme [Flavobacteriales bacterium]|nr:aminotransferase class I/II-fold pyridoxal phosphate-dependent enzyme [Flavobacteriales bacterium]
MGAKIMSDLDKYINDSLEKRKNEKLFRQLFLDEKGVDFITNDYLGFSRLINVETETEKHSPSASRLLGGNTKAIEDLEKHIAQFHGFETALYFNSGYNANTGLFACLLSRHDTYVFDEQVHASVRDGIRQSLAQNFSFRHNDVNDLEEKIKHSKGNVVVAVESVYSMDGDTAPLVKLAETCKKHGASLIVDEAHSIGLFGKEGRGLVHELKLTGDVFAVVYTYGKAMGCHGGAVACKANLRDYLVNFSRPFIYTTAPSNNQVLAVKTAYSLLTSPIREKNKLALRKNILFFVENMNAQSDDAVLHSHINNFMTGSNEKAIAIAQALRNKGFICRPVLSPTVAKGTERIRINLHSYNTLDEIKNLVDAFKSLNG